jgi:hypothetical protein
MYNLFKYYEIMIKIKIKIKQIFYWSNIWKMLFIMFFGICVFSCKDDNFDKNYTWVDAGLKGVEKTLNFDANAGTQIVSFTAPPEGSTWSYNKKDDWITVVRHNGELEISVALYEGITDDKLKDREGTVILVQETKDGIIEDAGTITVKQTCAVPNNWDNAPIPSYSWNWNKKDTFAVDLSAKQLAWDSTYLDDNNKQAYKYVYKIVGKDAANFVQTEIDTVGYRPNRQIKIANTANNESRDTLLAYLIVTDKDSKTIHVRRELKVFPRVGDFKLDKEEIYVTADSIVLEVEATALNKKSDSIIWTLIEVDEYKNKSDYSWITVLVNAKDTLRGSGKVKITVAANPSKDNTRLAILELVELGKNNVTKPFDPRVYLYIYQDRKSMYKPTN